MSSRLPTDEALEKEDRIDEIYKKKIKHSPPIPHLLQAQQAPALPYAKVVGRPGTALPVHTFNHTLQRTSNSALTFVLFLSRSGYSPGGRASKNYLPGRRVNNLLLARQRR